MPCRVLLECSNPFQLKTGADALLVWYWHRAPNPRTTRPRHLLSYDLPFFTLMGALQVHIFVTQRDPALAMPALRRSVRLSEGVAQFAAVSPSQLLQVI